jgi:hypothetical protein
VFPYHIITALSDLFGAIIKRVLVQSSEPSCVLFENCLLQLIN